MNPKIQFFHDSQKLEGYDKLIKTRNFKSCNFSIRFHLLPEINLTDKFLYEKDHLHRREIFIIKGVIPVEVTFLLD